MKKSTTIVAAVLIGLSSGAGMAVAGQAGAPQPAAVDRTPQVITVGDATVRRAPDRAFVTVATETRARSPKDAQQQNATAMTAVQGKLREAGIAASAVRTLEYTVEPEFDFANNKRTLRGYVARNTIDVTIDQLDRVGEIVDLVVASGASNVEGVRFDLRDRAAVEREALKAAVADARARAEAAAQGANMTIERVIRIEEQGMPRGPIPMAAPMRAQAMAAPQTPISPGQIEIRAQVTLTAALR